MRGDIHWNVSKLRKLAPYSGETPRSWGIGGFVFLLRGFNLLYHGVVFVASFLSTTSSSLLVPLLAVLSNLLPFSGSICVSGFNWLSLLTCFKGSVATGSAWFVLVAAATWSFARHSFSSPGTGAIFPESSFVENEDGGAY